MVSVCETTIAHSNGSIDEPYDLSSPKDIV